MGAQISRATITWPLNLLKCRLLFFVPHKLVSYDTFGTQNFEDILGYVENLYTTEIKVSLCVQNLR